MTAFISLIQQIAAAAIVLLLPGLAWQAWFPCPDRDKGERLAEAVGFSLSVTALLALAGFLFGFHYSGVGVAGITLVFGLIWLAGWLLRPRDENSDHATREWAGWLALALAVSLAVAWRLYQARTLVLPAWVDSVQHALITRVIFESGGLPASLAPYQNVPMYYHYGFHAAAALFEFWAEISVDRAVLVLGQVLNAAICFSVYRLARALWGDWKRGLIAGVLVGLAFHMPAYYVTWGRVTLTAGLVILPLVMAEAVEASRQTTWSWTATLRITILTAGLFLTHYLAALILGLFLVALGIQRLWNDLCARRLSKPAWARLLVGIGCGVLLALPWLVRIYIYSRSSFSVSANLAVDAPDQNYFKGYLDYLGYLAGPYRNYILLGLAFVGALVGLRKPGGRLLAGFTLILGLLCLPWGFQLGPFRPDLMVIVTFLPASLLAGDLIGDGGEAAAAVFKHRSMGWALAAAAVLALAVWGVIETRDILNPVTIFTDADDAQALQWIQNETPADARFFINVTLWQGPTYRGVDGGYWILPVTGRQTMLPPIVYAWGTAEHNRQINDLARQAEQVTGCSPELWKLMDSDELDYVYLHAGAGSLQPPADGTCPELQAVYHAGKVWIYRYTPTGHANERSRPGGGLQTQPRLPQGSAQKEWHIF
jgi:hypothetical protein